MTSSESSSTAFRVLTNPIVFRHIVEFQAGAPYQLLEFWGAQPMNQFCTIPAIQHKAFAANATILPKFVAQHGNAELLRLLSKVFIRNRGSGLFSTAPAPSGFWVTFNYECVVDIAIWRNDAAMLAVAVHHHPEYTARLKELEPVNSSQLASGRARQSKSPELDRQPSKGPAVDTTTSTAKQQSLEQRVVELEQQLKNAKVATLALAMAWLGQAAGNGNDQWLICVVLLIVLVALARK